MLAPRFEKHIAIPILGINVSKKNLDCALLLDGKLLDKSFDISSAGFKQLFEWLLKRKIARVHLCVETTGGFQDKVAIAFLEAGHAVSVLNPAESGCGLCVLAAAAGAFQDGRTGSTQGSSRSMPRATPWTCGRGNRPRESSRSSATS